ncbi:hypothetical protein LDO51_01115 [Providencia alcalifaciens]|uniref:hypothetical protein n=1 Tax=Providencia alcalifaciens TaxID=126385 RepID=UPI001CE2065B|nr:hypothetical protein [Providencia alcalifaciens]UBX49459.1 hypothetical protein LDO51_01115 [Providencia alcalifaciens]
MTTIVWDGKTLASDSQSQVGSMVTSIDSPKIHRPQHGKWVINNSEIKTIGIAGDITANKATRAMHRALVLGRTGTQGAIGDSAIYNRALNESEMSSTFNAIKAWAQAKKEIVI